MPGTVGRSRGGPGVIGQKANKPSSFFFLFFSFFFSFLFLFFSLFFSCLFTFEKGGGAEREGDTESEAGSRLRAVGAKSEAGLEPRDCEMVT